MFRPEHLRDEGRAKLEQLREQERARLEQEVARLQKATQKKPAQHKRAGGAAAAATTTKRQKRVNDKEAKSIDHEEEAEDHFAAGSCYLDVANARDDKTLADLICQVGNTTYNAYNDPTCKTLPLLYQYSHDDLSVSIQLCDKRVPVVFTPATLKENIGYQVRVSSQEAPFAPFDDLWDAAAFVAAYRMSPELFYSPESPAWTKFNRQAMAADQAYKQYWDDADVCEADASEDMIEEARILAIAAAMRDNDATLTQLNLACATLV